MKGDQFDVGIVRKNDERIVRGAIGTARGDGKSL